MSTLANRRMTTGELNLQKKRPNDADDDVSYKLQRLSVVNEQSGTSIDDDLIGPQRIIHNDNDRDEAYDHRRESTIIRDEPTTAKQLLTSLTRLPRDHPTLSLLRDRQRETPKKIIGYPNNMKSIDNQRYHHMAINKYFTKHEYTKSLPTSYRQITPLQFEEMLDFLMKRVFPNFKFHNYSLQYKVQYAVDKLKYPLGDSVLKSLSELGTMHTTFIYNAFLHHLVNLAEGLDMPLLSIDEKPFELDREGITNLRFQYTLARLHNNDPTISNKKLKDAFDDLKARKTRRKEELQAEIDRVKAEIAQMKATSNRRSAAAARNNELQKDLTKFNTHIDHKSKRVAKFKDLNSRVKEEIASLNQKIIHVDKEKSQSLAKLNEKNVTVEEVKQLMEDHATLEEESGQCASQLESVKQQIQEFKVKSSRLKEQVKKVVDEYNTKVRSLAYFSMDNQKLLIDYDALMDENSSYSLKDISTLLEKLNDDAKAEFSAISRETFDLRQENSEIQASVNDAKTRLKDLEEQGSALKEDYEERHLLFRNETEKFNKVIAKNQKEQEKKINERLNLALEAREKLNAEKERLNTLKLDHEIKINQMKTMLQQIISLVSTQYPKQTEIDQHQKKDFEEILNVLKSN